MCIVWWFQRWNAEELSIKRTTRIKKVFRWYDAGTREILECFFDDVPIRIQYLIVQNGELTGAHSYSKGTATSGSEEAERYKK